MNTNIYYSPIDYSDSYICSAGDYPEPTEDISNELISNIDNGLFINENINFINKDNFYNDMFVIKLELLKYVECDTFLLDSQLNILKSVKNNNKIETIASEILYLLIRDNQILIDDIKLEILIPILDKLNYEIDNLDTDLLIETIKGLMSNGINDKNIKLINTFIDFKNEFIEKQDELLKLESDLIKDISINKDDIDTIDNMLKKTEQLNKKYDENNENDKMIKTMLDLSKMLYENSNIVNSKQKYIEKRKEINNYISVIRYINCFNNCNICKICLTNPVNNYIIPCGHTACTDCLSKQKQYQGDSNFKCGLCRVLIEDVKKLYL